MLSLSSYGIVGLVVLCSACMAGWLRWALPQVGPDRKTLVLTSLVVLVLWLGLVAGLAQSGFLAEWSARPPHLPLVPLAALLMLILVNRTQVFLRLVEITPAHWPVALQTFRIGVELCFYALFLAGSAPVQVTFEGQNFDVFVGLSAPFVALAIWKLNLSPRAVIAWNVAGLFVLFNTIVTVLGSTPGPLHREWPGEPFVALASWPVIWIPGLLAPFAIFLHLFSIRQNLLRMQTAAVGSANLPS